MVALSPQRRLHPPAAAVVFAVIGGVVGCYAPNIQDGTLSCAGGSRCPRGFVCRPEVRLCYRIQNDAAPTDAIASCDRDGTCDGNRGCKLWRAGTICGASACSAGTATPAPTCDGLGQCAASTPRACAPYACNGSSACFDSCTASSQCQAPN